MPLVVLFLLLAFVSADPAPGVTISNGPFTDEAWDVVNARNLVLLGTWSTDDWNLHLVNVPFSVITAAVFQVAGVGIVQARLISIAATVVTIGALGFGPRRRLARGPRSLPQPPSPARRWCSTTVGWHSSSRRSRCG